MNNRDSASAAPLSSARENPFFRDWAPVGCTLVHRNLSMAEWTQLLPDTSYERTCPELPAGPGAPQQAPPARYPDD